MRIMPLLALTLFAGCASVRTSWVGCFSGGNDHKVVVGGSAAFRRLLAVIDSPPVLELDESRIPVDVAGLRAALAMEAGTAAPSAKRWFLEYASDPVQVRALLKAEYTGVTSTTQRTAWVRIWSARGRVDLSSDSQLPFMIPWTIQRAGKSFTSWNPEIGRALAAVLPRDFANRETMKGGGLSEDLGMVADFSYGSELLTRSTAELLGEQLDPIRRRFRIDSAALQGTQLRATLSAEDLRQLRFAVLLPVRSGRLETEPFLRAVDELVRRVRALKWLQAYLAATPESVATIGFSDPKAKIDLELQDQHGNRERWTVSADGRSHLDSAGEIVALKAVCGDWLTDEGELQLGPGHR